MSSRLLAALLLAVGTLAHAQEPQSAATSPEPAATPPLSAEGGERSPRS